MIEWWDKSLEVRVRRIAGARASSEWAVSEWANKRPRSLWGLLH